MSERLLLVIGAGSWGTALSFVLARNGHETHLWGRSHKHLKTMQQKRENARYLPSFAFPDKLSICDNLTELLPKVDDILIVVPSHAYRDTLELIKPHCDKQVRIISATKGLDPSSRLFLSEVTAEVFGDSTLFAVLTGPSFAKDVAEEQPTAVNLASEDKAFAQQAASYFHNKSFRVYPSQDIVGVQVAGAVKNVLAIAAGVASGLGFGANTQAALITRGLAEMSRLATALGGEPQTMMGLAGIGDLMLTCMDNQSRNRRFGLALGQGQSRISAEQSIGQVVEGIRNAEDVFALAKQHHIDMPITEQVNLLVTESVSPQQAVENLLSREINVEDL